MKITNLDNTKRVVVTGMGIISCLGNDLDSVTESLKAGKPGYEIDPSRTELGFRGPITGMIRDFNPKKYLDRKKRKTMAESTIWAYAAAEQAVAQSGLQPEHLANPETGIIMGHDSVTESSYEMCSKLLEEKDTKNIGSGYIFKVMNSTVTMNLGTIFHTQGANWTLSGACASGSHSVGQAAELIRSGQQERMIAGGAQEINWHSMASFDTLGAFSTRVDEPLKASRPFDKDRNGLIPSGGSAVLVLERLDLALERGATILGEILSYSFSSDGEDLQLPNGIGARRAMRKALKMAGLEASDIDYINAHATSTPQGDAKEAEAIFDVFGGTPYVSSTKSMTGHECWMAGASELIYSLLMMNGSFIAPNVNYEEGDEVTSKINVTNKRIDMNLNTILSNSFGFGGTNAVVILSKYTG